jgi:UDP-N-acetylmuramyl pentapeptide phosphotransferase/UDP-N-acetylglucosamine-1-phosphate transferase
MTTFALLITLAISTLVTALAVPPVLRVSQRLGLLQAADTARRIHKTPTSRLGGVAIYAGFVCALIVSLTFAPLDPALRRSPYELLRIDLLLLGGTLIFCIMLIDDVAGLTPLTKLVGQVAAALIAVGPYLWERQLYGPRDEANGIILTAFNLPLLAEPVHLHNLSPWLAIAATVFWIVGMMNTINFVDGLDGLAAGIVLIAAAILSAHALRLNQLTIALLPLALAGACLGFLYWNFNPAKIFMGDCGAMFLGYVLAVSAIIGGAKLATALLVLALPILDVAWLIVQRTRRGSGIARAGRDHLHHRLLALGWSQRQIVAFYYGLSILFGSLGLLPSEQNPALRWFKLGGLLVLCGLLVVLLVYLARQQKPVEHG